MAFVPTKKLTAEEEAFLADLEQRAGTPVRTNVWLHLIGHPDVPNLSQIDPEDRKIIRELVAKHRIDLPTSPP